MLLKETGYKHFGDFVVGCCESGMNLEFLQQENLWITKKP
jgi:hypothetical protein